MASYATPEYTRTQVDKAGNVWVSPTTSDVDWVWALDVINNWRASHIFPLNNIQTNLRYKVKSIQSDVLVAQRIKRLESIGAKLSRGQTSTLNLSQMQDIGGCRAVLKSSKNVAKLIDLYRESRFNHILRGEKDYISTPKEDGYRGYHLIYQYQSRPGQNEDFDKLRIEIQIRTVVQHVWATAVEAVGAFTQQALKSAEGSQEWLRLFALMSSAIAASEGGASVPSAPSSAKELIDELRDVATRLDAVRLLRAYRATLDYVGQLKEKSSKYFLVHFDRQENKVWVRGFAANASQPANLAYTQLESNKKTGDNIVLVSVDSIRALRRAYPNYFLDTEQFANLLDGFLKEGTGLPNSALKKV